MQTDLRPAQIQPRKALEPSATHWFIAFITGFLLSSCALATPNIPSHEAKTLASVSISKPSLRIAIAEALLVPLKDDINLLRQAFDYAGYELQLVPLPAQRGLRNAAAGELDGEFLRRREDVTAYTSLLPIEEPLRHVALWVWMRSDSQCPDSPKDLHKFSMATVLSYGFIKRIPVSSASKKFQTNSVASSLRVLQAGRVDYVLFDKRGMSYYKRTLSVDVKSCFDNPISSTDYFSFMHNKHRDKIPALTAALRRVKREQAAQ